VHAGWIEGARGKHFKGGALDDLVDFGVGRGKVEEFVRRLIGEGAARPADLLLSGHGHRRVEYRVGKSAAGELRLFTDFYSENPDRYYAALVLTKDLPAHGDDHFSVYAAMAGATRRVHTTVKAGAPEDGEPKKQAQGTYAEHYRIDIPPYATPLAEASSPAQWWQKHRPLVVETAGLGPVENRQRKIGSPPEKPGTCFAGFRFVRVRDNVIARMHYVELAELRANGLRMPWEPKKPIVASEPVPSRLPG
jgi:hypothetical protein